MRASVPSATRRPRAADAAVQRRRSSTCSVPRRSLVLLPPPPWALVVAMLMRRVGRRATVARRAPGAGPWGLFRWTRGGVVSPWGKPVLVGRCESVSGKHCQISGPSLERKEKKKKSNQRSQHVCCCTSDEQHRAAPCSRRTTSTTAAGEGPLVRSKTAAPPLSDARVEVGLTMIWSSHLPHI